MIVRHIERLRTPEASRVFVATNHQKDHPIMRGLRQHYGSALLLWEDLSVSCGIVIAVFRAVS